jgi:hypothetical protein
LEEGGEIGVGFTGELLDCGDQSVPRSKHVVTGEPIAVWASPALPLSDRPSELDQGAFQRVVIAVQDRLAPPNVFAQGPKRSRIPVQIVFRVSATSSERSNVVHSAHKLVYAR